MAQAAELKDCGSRFVRGCMLHSFSDVPHYVTARLSLKDIKRIVEASGSIDEDLHCLIVPIAIEQLSFHSERLEEVTFPATSAEIHVGQKRLVIRGGHPDSFVTWSSEPIWIKELHACGS